MARSGRFELCIHMPGQVYLVFFELEIIPLSDIEFFGVLCSFHMCFKIKLTKFLVFIVSLHKVKLAQSFQPPA